MSQSGHCIGCRRWRSLVAGIVALATPAIPAGAAGEEADLPIAAPAQTATAQLCSEHPTSCDCPGCRAFFDACDEGFPLSEQTYPPYDSGAIGEGYSGILGDATAEGAAAPSLSGPTTSLPAGLGAVAVASSASPSMIGDFFGKGFQYAVASPVNGATVAVGGGDRLRKFADNASPIPTNRVYFNYHHFHNSVIDVNGRSQDTNRFTFGLERTIWGGLGSLEFRLPFAASVDGTQQIGAAGTLGTEFGNLSLTTKLLAYENDSLAVGGGLGIVFPTASDGVVLDGSGNPAIIFTNEAFHLQPFVGFYHRPNNRLFQQFVTQVSFDLSGNVIDVRDPSFFGGSGSDRVFDQTLLFIDYSIGHWVYRSRRCTDILTGIAPMVELHYTSTLDPLDEPAIGESDVFEPDFRRDALNLTGGMFFELGRYTGVKAAGVAPLRGGTDRLFDAEFGLQLIHRY